MQNYCQNFDHFLTKVFFELKFKYVNVLVVRLKLQYSAFSFANYISAIGLFILCSFYKLDVSILLVITYES